MFPAVHAMFLHAESSLVSDLDDEFFAAPSATVARRLRKVFSHAELADRPCNAGSYRRANTAAT
jgi:hypothetical protein